MRLIVVPRCIGRILIAAQVLLPSLATGLALAQSVVPPVRVSTAPGVHYQPDLAVFGDTMVAVWSGAASFPYTEWGSSTDAGTTWTYGGQFAPDTSWSQTQASVAVDGTGTFYAVEILRDHLGVFRGSFSAGTLSWSHDIRLPLPEAKYDAPSIAATADGVVFVACTQGSSIVFLKSSDHGSTWSQPVQLSSDKCNGSSIVIGPSGEVYVAWEDFRSEEAMITRSIDGGGSFDPPSAISPMLDNLGYAPHGWETGGRNNPVYSSGRYFAPGFPSIAVDVSSGPRRGWVYATWTEFSDGTVAAPTTGFTDREPNNSFSQATPVAIGSVGRGSVYELNPDYFTFHGTAGDLIQVDARILTWAFGRSFFIHFYCSSAPYPVRLGRLETRERDLGPMPPLIVSLPATGNYFLSLGGGSLGFGYEISITLIDGPGSVALDHRDVVMAHSSDGGQTWSRKARVNSDPPGSDQALPSVAVDHQGRVHLAWYDWRDSLGCRSIVNTYWTHSDDGGQTFAAETRVGDPSWWHAPDLSGPNIGDHLALKPLPSGMGLLWTQIDSTTIGVLSAVLSDEAVPTTVSHLAARHVPEGVLVSWWMQAASAVSYRILRYSGGSDAIVLAELPVHSHQTDYRYLDAGVMPGSSFAYGLEVAHAGGTSARYGPIAPPHSPTLGAVAMTARPNPFSRHSQVWLELPARARVRLTVHDVAGRRVATPFDGMLDAGPHAIPWTPLDTHGRDFASGLYLLRAIVGNQIVTARALYIP